MQVDALKPEIREPAAPAAGIGRAATRSGLLFVVLAAALWGTSGITTKTIYSLVDISPVTAAAFRLGLGAPMLAAAFRYTTGARSLRIARGDFAWMLLAGASLGLSQACYFSSISRVGVAVATLVAICTAPVLVCLLSAALLRERLTLAVGGALACALAGTVLLIGVGQGGTAAQTSASVGGILLAVGAAFCFSGFILMSRLIANRYHPLLSITVAVGAGAALLIAIVAVTIGLTLRYPPAVWALFLYLGLVPTALAYALFYRGVQYTTASEASIASLLEPLTSTGLALVIFGEHLGSSGLLGAALLIGAIVFLYWNGPSRAG